MKEIRPLFDPGSPAATRPLIIAGPCSAETREQTLATAASLAAAGVKVFRAGVWKPRTKPGGFEGMGEPALEWLADVKKSLGMAVATEVATAAHVEAAVSAGIDVLWIGARTSANPFAVQEIADSLGSLAPDTPLLVKNPVNPDLELWVGALQRLYNAGVRRLGAIHRGFSVYGNHGYRNHPLWGIPLEFRTRFPHIPLLGDPSHIGGDRLLVAPLAQEAMAMGFDGLIVECHCNPDAALSDASQQLTPEALARMLATLSLRPNPVGRECLAHLRERIDTLDAELLNVLARRMDVSREIGDYKRGHSIPVVQSERFVDLIASRISSGEEAGLSPAFVRSLFNTIHEESVRVQVKKG